MQNTRGTLLHTHARTYSQTKDNAPDYQLLCRAHTTARGPLLGLESCIQFLGFQTKSRTHMWQEKRVGNPGALPRLRSDAGLLWRQKHWRFEGTFSVHQRHVTVLLRAFLVLGRQQQRDLCTGSWWNSLVEEGHPLFNAARWKPCFGVVVPTLLNCVT